MSMCHTFHKLTNNSLQFLHSQNISDIICVRNWDSLKNCLATTLSLLNFQEEKYQIASSFSFGLFHPARLHGAGTKFHIHSLQPTAEVGETCQRHSSLSNSYTHVVIGNTITNKSSFICVHLTFRHGVENEAKTHSNHQSHQSVTTAAFNKKEKYNDITRYPHMRAWKTHLPTYKSRVSSMVNSQESRTKVTTIPNMNIQLSVTAIW